MGSKKKRGKKGGFGSSVLWLLEYILATSVLAVVRLLPFKLAIRLGGLLGRFFYIIDRRHREITENNLRESFGGKSPEEIKSIARSVYTNLGYSAVEFMRSDRYAGRPVEEHFSFANYDSYLSAHSRGKGVLFLTGHCGSWELLALAQSVIGRPFDVVVRPLDNPYLDKAVSAIRTRFGNTLINKTKGMRDILRALNSGRAVGILLDQNVSRREGVFVDFFGRPACTNIGLALIAAKTGAPVVPAFIRRVGLDRHEIILGDEIPLVNTGDKEADVKTNTQAYTKAIEDFVRAYPDQWFWMHRRWKTRPEES